MQDKQEWLLLLCYRLFQFGQIRRLDKRIDIVLHGLLYDLHMLGQYKEMRPIRGELLSCLHCCYIQMLTMALTSYFLLLHFHFLFIIY